LALIPRIEVTSVFTGSQIAQKRKEEFDYYGCNYSYYDITQAAAPEKCVELIQNSATEIFNGATRKSLIEFSFF
jgi:coxsackievirus/adenovirus receptor